jgi:hypothetical protein
MRVGPNCAELSTLLNEIDVPHYEAAVITDLSTESVALGKAWERRILK